jgi:cell division protein FtsB
LLGKSGAHRRRRARTRRSLARAWSVGPRTRRLSSSLLSAPRALAARVPISLPSLRRLGTRSQPSVERRRARALLLAAMIFAAAVLLSALPWSTLVNQHAQLSSATAEVSALQSENAALSVQARELSNNATQAGLARQDYGLVEPGQKAYQILPPPGTASPDATEAGHVPLNEGPVVPGSRRSEELMGVGAASTTSPGTSTATSGGGTGDAAHQTGTTVVSGTSGTSADSGGFWSRVGHTLEFWN